VRTFYVKKTKIPLALANLSRNMTHTQYCRYRGFFCLKFKLMCRFQTLPIFMFMVMMVYSCVDDCVLLNYGLTSFTGIVIRQGVESLRY